MRKNNCFCCYRNTSDQCCKEKSASKEHLGCDVHPVTGAAVLNVNFDRGFFFFGSVNYMS